MTQSHLWFLGLSCSAAANKLFRAVSPKWGVRRWFVGEAIVHAFLVNGIA